MSDELVSLTYRSRVLLADPETDLLHIMRVSRLRNPRMGISGILLYNGFHFVQTLEGPRSACAELFSRISGDPRHAAIMAFGLRTIGTRRFPDWAMRLVSRQELRITVPELEQLDLTGADDIEQMHARICAALSTRPTDDGSCGGPATG